ncbi:M14 family zinc carboxypeptidase [Bacillus litorisediminis]|uniref:M14 family zinc carboxypeptidase n=1 Tax=Bacillus litorisediminis TaxID=2922713 RepID=UPI001FACC83C|nr:M14 family zinc carboxypeptidase [Bacillus litorisediminis]
MQPNNTIKKVMTGVLATSIIAAPFALTPVNVLAQPQTTPNGPYVELEQNVSLSSFMTNEELFERLQQLQEQSKGKMELDIAGYSNEGSPLYVAKYGDNDPNKKKLLIYTQIHGNEPLGTEAVVELMQKFNSGGQEINELLDQVSVWIMPRVNPDGTMTEYEGEQYPVRYSHQEWNPEALGLAPDTSAPWYYNEGTERAQGNNGRIDYGIPGYDLNRDFHPNFNFDITKEDPAKVEAILNNPETNNIWNTGFLVSPEAKAVTSVVQEFEPDAVIDVHHRGFNQLSEEDDRSVSISVLGQFTTVPYTDPFTGKVYEIDEDVLELSKQMTVVAYESLQRGYSSFGAIQQYPQVNYPGSGLGAIQLNGAATTLIEVKGQTQTLGQKQSGMLKETVKTPIYEIMKALADGSIRDVDASLYEDIPPAYGGIGDPSTRDF